MRDFLYAVLPSNLPPHPKFNASSDATVINTREDFIESVSEAISVAPMAIRITPHTISVIDWSDPVNDPVRRQFIPMRNELIADHHRLTLDSLNEERDSPVKGLVHRYPTKALFLGRSSIIDSLTKAKL